ncbi:Phage-related protein [Mameliella alba]|uniref:hypothetical protein n=1 Tax=Mameliella alba TaxID=561184 RepID=UPI0008832BDC|nr:hypothetical protein [Mameliella alba]OWV41884.1 hypothetical protein CDZ96_24410 [Mameliella alba]PTR35556.1 phage-related protein [Mameliella alba]GGF82879.1 hypothetical protein GCM10011319_48640 [Mameliella alba]SDE20129.1 Phage-related protein [Mameliella alba]
MAIEIGALRALLSLDSAAFERGAKRAEASMNGLQRSLKAASRKLGGIGKKLTTRVTLPIVGIGAAAVKSSLATIDAQSKMAQSLGASTAAVQVLSRAADRAGLSSGELEQVARQLTKRLSQVAATGKGPAADALKRLGIRAADLAEMDLDQKIGFLNKAIAETIPEAERAAISMALFGSRAGLVAGRLDAATIEAARKEMEKFGVVVSEVDADAIETANDAISGLGLVARGLGNQLAVALTPTLNAIAETLANWAAKFSALDPRMKAIIAGVVAFAAAAGPLAMGLGFVAAGLAALASPIGLVIVGLIAVAAAAAYVASNWDTIKRDYPATASALEAVGAAAKDIGSGMADAIKRAFEAGETMLRGGISTYQALVDGDLKAAFEGIKTVAGAAVSAAIAQLDLFTLGGASALKDAIIGMGAKIEEFLPGLVEKARSIGTKIKAAVTEKVPDFILAGMDIAKAIAEGLREMIGRAVDYVKDLGPKIVAAIKEMAESVIAAAKQLGTDLVEGIRLGIAEKIETAKAAIRNAFTGVIGTAKETVDSHSPSRVFMQIGRDLMDGARIGIDEKAPEAARAAARAGEAATKAMDQAVEAAGPSQLEVYIGRISDAMAQAIVDGKSMGDALRQVFKQIAKDLIASGIRKLIGGLFGGLLGGGGGAGIFGGFKGFFAKGGTLGAGEWGIAGEAGPEPVVGPARIIPNSAMSQGGGSMAISVTVSGARGNAEIEEMVQRGVQGGLAQYDRILPDRVAAIRRDPRVRY